ncbi:CbrC family protein [Telmatobacter sp. DSM 110680]|uniref:CbrC family protein n=1 Tax=Telmatobacter sp. DSM 110680 TaxID=3036704 RepID=A0AAU7DF69_9BACT
MPEVVVTALPEFRYHPDPVGTGSIIPSSVECCVCKRSMGWIYVGPTYSEADIDEQICPWCIADGSAHRLFGAEFVDPPGVGGYGDWETAPTSVVDEICFCTPSFNGWQQERWFTHCGDAAIFLGCAGKQELEKLDRAAYAAIKSEFGYDDEEWERYFNRLDINCGPTAYLFRCRHCGAWGGYSDCG